jgi:membrane protein YdbS with pleckstrin-like domain
LIKLFLVLIPAIIVAAIVYLFTGDLLWTGIAFLVVALLSIIAKI